jgi:hypothetical protein
LDASVKLREKPSVTSFGTSILETEARLSGIGTKVAFRNPEERQVVVSERVERTISVTEENQKSSTITVAE